VKTGVKTGTYLLFLKEPAMSPFSLLSRALPLRAKIHSVCSLTLIATGIFLFRFSWLSGRELNAGLFELCFVGRNLAVGMSILMSAITLCGVGHLASATARARLSAICIYTAIGLSLVNCCNVRKLALAGFEETVVETMNVGDLAAWGQKVTSEIPSDGMEYHHISADNLPFAFSTSLGAQPRRPTIVARRLRDGPSNSEIQFMYSYFTILLYGSEVEIGDKRPTRRSLGHGVYVTIAFSGRSDKSCLLP
jgi:hypothetical protein